MIAEEGDLPCLRQFSDYFSTDLNQIPFVDHIQIYGSYLLQYICQLPYVSNKSDLDILIHYPGVSLNALSNLLCCLEEVLKLKIDGEVRFEQLGDISINELLNESTFSCIVKNTHQVNLFKRQEIYECYPQLCQ